MIRNGTIVAEGDPYRADIGIINGVIAEIRAPNGHPIANAEETIDAIGKFVLPGAIDCHVHFRQPGYEHKEDWSTGSLAAAFGGVTTVIDMPNTSPPTDLVEHFLAKKEVAKARSHVDFGLYGLVSDRSYRNIAALHEAGCVGFKCYLSNSASSHIAMINDGALLEAFETIAAIGTRCIAAVPCARICGRTQLRVSRARPNTFTSNWRRGLLDRHVLEGAVRPVAGVVHEHVDAALLAQDPFDARRDRRVIRHVHLERAHAAGGQPRHAIDADARRRTR